MVAGRYDLAEHHVAGAEGIFRSGAGATSPAASAALSTEVAIVRARLARLSNGLPRSLAAQPKPGPGSAKDDGERTRARRLGFAQLVDQPQRRGSRAGAVDAPRLSIALRVRTPAMLAPVSREDYGISGHFLELSWLLFSTHRRHGD